jgi:hypothetical protein
MLTVAPYADRLGDQMYAKLYSTILRSSIWLEDAETRLLWITLLAAADEQGFVFGSPAGMAHTARISPEAAKAALVKLAAPDPDSSDLSENPENEGRRIEVVDGGWRLINYSRYRSIRDSEERREQNREAKRRERERAKSAKISRGQPASAKISPSESYSEAESKKEISFDDFWSLYPKKVGKPLALKAWAKLDGKTHGIVIEAIRIYRFSPDRQFIPHPATWLNGRRWEDETDAAPEPAKPDAKALAAKADADREAEAYQNALKEIREMEENRRKHGLG